MAPLRVTLRLAGLAVATIAGFAVVALLALRARMFYVRRDGRPAVFRAWARVVAPTLGVKIEAAGPVPEPPCLVVANHLSYLDIIVLGTQVPCVFVAKSELGEWPVVGTICRAAGTLFVDRADRFRLPSVIAAMTRVLETGGAVVVFPEATSSDGRQVLPFRPSTLEAAVAGGFRVYSAALLYETDRSSPPPERAVCWWGAMTFVDHLVGLLALPRVTARVRFGRDDGTPGDRRVLAARLHQAVTLAHAELRARATASSAAGAAADPASAPDPDRQPRRRARRFALVRRSSPRRDARVEHCETERWHPTP